MTGGRDLDSGSARGDIYRRLGVEPIVNGRSTFTILGGSLMAPPVLEAMRQAAGSFVDLLELQAAVGRRLAELTRNEAAFVCGGAAAGLFLSAAAAIVRDTDDGVLRLDDLGARPRDFVIHRAHRIPYDKAIELAGGRLVEIGGPDATDETELVNALTPSTAAVVYVPKSYLAAAVLPLETLVQHAQPLGIPVIVDAAAQLPPPENLWRFSKAGADVVLFSGGKALCGPAGTGLVVGSSRFVGRLGANAAPLQRLGRPMKIGKEDMVGLLAAVEWYLAQDHDAIARRHDAVVQRIVDWGRGRDDVLVERLDTGEAGQPTPRAWIRLTSGSAESRDGVLAALRATPPRIDLLADDGTGFFVAPETLVPGEEEIVTTRLADVLRIGHGGGAGAK
jgi:D-glucosaminate-6-phosphate ammonia-lyase